MTESGNVFLNDFNTIKSFWLCVFLRNSCVCECLKEKKMWRSVESDVGEFLKWWSYFVLQHDCPYCGRLFSSKRKMSEHARMCAFCENCNIFTDLRHVATCKSPKPRKGVMVRCPSCHAFKSKRNISRHMKLVHDEKGWKLSDHPQLISVVSKCY